MSKITWGQTDNWHNAFIGLKQVGCCYKSIENADTFYWVSGSENGKADSLEEAKKRIEELNDK